MMAFPFTGRIEVVWLLLLQTTYSYFFVLRLRKGLPRLMGLLPLFPPSLLVPWRAATVSERVVLSFLVIWMIDTKLLLLAWDMGPAADPIALSTFPRFFFSITSAVHLKREQQVFNRKKHDVAVVDNPANGEDEQGRKGNSNLASVNSLVRNEDGRKSSSNSRSDGISSGLIRRNIARADFDGKLHNQGNELHVEGPIRVAANGGCLLNCIQMIATSQTGGVVLVRSIFHFMVALSLLRILLAWKHLMSEYVLDLILPFYVYFGCLFLFEVSAAIPACLLGTEVRAQFNRPFLADSLADFWGRRWNLLVNNLLRVSIYEPVLRLFNARTKPTPWGRVVSTAATFLVSGLMHEVFCFYGSRKRPTWELTAFFALQGVATIVEGFVFQPRQRSGVLRLLRRASTLIFVYITAYWLLFPPLIRSGVIDTALEEVGQFIDWMQGQLIWWQH